MRMSQQDLPNKSGRVINRSELRIETGFPQCSHKELFILCSYSFQFFFEIFTCAITVSKKNPNYLVMQLQFFLDCKCGRRHKTGAKCAVHKDENCFLFDPTWAQDVCV